MIKLETIAGEKGFMVNCDKCPYYEFFIADQFVEAVKEAQRQGWLFKFNEEKEWEHFCEDCKGRG